MVNQLYTNMLRFPWLLEEFCFALYIFNRDPSLWNSPIFAQKRKSYRKKQPQPKLKASKFPFFANTKYAK